MSAGVGEPKRRTPAATSLVGSTNRAERGVVARVTRTELEQAVSGVDVPPVLAWDSSGTVRLANKAAAEMFGRSLAEIVGMRLDELVGPTEEVARTLLEMTMGRFVAVHVHRTAHVRGGQELAVLATGRAIEVDGSLGGVTILVPETEPGRLGRHPLQAWIDVVPVALGFTDGNWMIESISTEVEELLDRTPEEVIGRSLLELVSPDDVDELRGSDDDRLEPRSLARLRFVLPTGDDVEVCVLLAPRPPPEAGMRFALLGRIESYFPQQDDRVTELELRLRRIGAEVRAAGLIEAPASPVFHDHPGLGELSTRQWEILSRLLEGERVPTIAKELFISRSTVRNHLATIFQRFGVHSQAELLEQLRQPVNR